MIKCTYPNGSEAGLRHVTVDGIIVRDNKILLNKRGLYNGKPMLEFGKWALIGGYADRDETLQETLKREAKEEAGCEIDNIRLLRIKDNPDRAHEDNQNISFVMVADFISTNEIKTEEVLELKWFNIDDLPAFEEIAFDHGDDLKIYVEFIKSKQSLESIKRLPAILL